MDELAAQLPNAPLSPTEIVLRAKVAFCHADKVNGRLRGILSDKAGDDEASAARLIDSVLQSAHVSQ